MQALSLSVSATVSVRPPAVPIVLGPSYEGCPQGVHLLICQFAVKMLMVIDNLLFKENELFGVEFRKKPAKYPMMKVHETLEQLRMLVDISLVSRAMFHNLMNARENLAKQIADMAGVRVSDYPMLSLSYIDEGQYLKVYRFWLQIRLKSQTPWTENEMRFRKELLHRTIAPNSPYTFSKSFFCFLLDMDKTYQLGLTGFKNNRGFTPRERLQEVENIPESILIKRRELLLVHEAALPAVVSEEGRPKEMKSKATASAVADKVTTSTPDRLVPSPVISSEGPAAIPEKSPAPLVTATAAVEPSPAVQPVFLLPAGARAGQPLAMPSPPLMPPSQVPATYRSPVTRSFLATCCKRLSTFYLRVRNAIFGFVSRCLKR